MSSPLVSVCLPNLNTRAYLEERVASILAQTFRDWELIISDNFSDDGSWEYLQKFKDDPRIRLTQAPRRGMYANWNECLTQARGDYIYVATSDDTASPALLEKLLAALAPFPEIDLAVCDFDFIDAQGKILPNTDPYSPKRFLGEWTRIHSLRNGKTDFLISAVYGPSWATMTSVLFRRRLLERTGLFRTDVGSQADHEWALRAMLASDVVYIPETLATWRQHEQQATSHWAGKQRQLTRNNLTMIQAVIGDPRAGIPAEWRSIPGWAKHLQSLWRTEFLDSFDLYRGVLRRRPRHFLANCWHALLEEPAFLMRQVLTAFQWSNEFSPDRKLAVEQLIELFHASWPPQRIN